MDIEKILSDKRSSQAHIGLLKEEFEKLLFYFIIAYEKYLKKNKRPNKKKAGRKSKLDTHEKRLFYILYYLKTYPTFDVLGGVFGMDRGTACKWVHVYIEVLKESLNIIGVLPKRKIKSKEEFLEIFPNVEVVISDGTERRRRRPKNKEKQKEFYSGKKKPTQ